MKLTPFWTDDFPRPADLPVAAELPAQVDVAIIGGEYTGLNAARVLAQSGAKVAVFERESIGWGASSRNGGMTMPGLKQGTGTILKRYGEEKGREFWQTSLDAMDLINQPVIDEELDYDWHFDGYVAHGLSMATYLGSEIGLLLSGQKSRSPFAEIPHNTRWFYRNRPWFVPFAAQYYRFLDWIS